jgi:aminomethyltransferase
MSQKTPLFEQHRRLGGRLVEFGGWQLPVQYEGILSEQAHCRRAACVFDTSHMGQFFIGGAGADAALAGALTQDAAALPTGRGRYGFLLNESGGIVDDCILFRPAADEFLLVVNAATREKDAAWLRRYLPGTVAIDDPTLDRGKIDLQGPASAAVLGEHVDLDLSGLGYFGVTQGNCCGEPAVIARSGYTGELGYEIFPSPGSAEKVFVGLLEHDAVKPAGLGARDILRLEMGYPLYGQDIDEQTSPLEAGAGRFIDLDRRFVGRDALAGVAEKGIEKTLVAFRTETRRRSDHDQPITDAGDVVGSVTSAGFSPSLGVSIGLGYVRPELAEPGTRLAVGHMRGDLPATVEARPLYRDGTCRTRNLTWEGEK